jgi:hypothetical protein
MPLSDLIIRGAEPATKPIKLFDAEGLHLEVSPNSGRWWRLKYRFAGKERRLSLGTYPQVSLKEARIRRAAAKIQVSKGIDPSAARQAAIHKQGINAENSFETVGREWWAQWKDAHTPDHATRVLRRPEANLFPPLGKRPVAEITTPEIVAAIKKIEARGALDIAKRALHTAGQIYRYATRGSVDRRNRPECPWQW